MPGLILGALVLGLLLRPWSGGSVPSNPLDGSTFTRLTDSAGAKFGATISRDGKNVAFVSDRDGQFDIWVIALGTGLPLNLTNGSANVRSMLRDVGFSHDGSELWVGGTMDLNLRRMPLAGGAMRSWLDPHAVNVSWSPDGTQIVYHTSEAGDPLVVADRDGSNPRVIVDSEPGIHQHFPTWANDGWIYLTRGPESTYGLDLCRIRPDGTALEQLPSGTRFPEHPTPIDARTLLFVAQEENGAGPWLWAFDLESKVARRLSYGLEQYTSLAASADGRRLVASIATPQASLWEFPISDDLVTEDDVRPFEVPSVRALAPRFGPEDLFYLSSRGSGDGLWRYGAGGLQELWKGTESPILEPVEVSADGASIALVLRKDKRNVLHVLSADGAVLRALSSAIDVRGSASWSPDGTWIVAGGEDAEGGFGLFKFNVDTEQVEKITDDQAMNPVWSPDGELIVYVGTQVRADAPLLGIRPDGTPVDLPLIEVLWHGQRARFLPDGRALIHMVLDSSLSQEFWRLDLTTMEDHQLTQLDDTGLIKAFDITPDGQRIVFDRLRDNSDIVLIDLAER